MQEKSLTTRYIFTTLFTIIIYLITVTAAGVLNELLLHLRHFRLSLFTTLKEHALGGTYIRESFTHPNLFTWLAIAITLGFFAFDNWKTWKIFKNTRRQYEVRDRYAAYGTSRWQNRQETAQYYERDNKGFLFGDYDKTTYSPLPDAAFQDPKIAHYAVHPWTSDLNQQYIVFGPPGSDKTTGFILPNIFHAAQQGVSVVATDPKGELYELTADYMRRQGYRVIVLDYIHFQHGQRLNLLNYVYDEAQIAELASMYLESTRHAGDKKDFWEGKAQELFTSLIGFVKQAYGDKGTLTDVYRLIPHVTDPEYLLSLYARHRVTGMARDLMNSITAMAKSENTLGNIAATLSEKLFLFALSNVRSQTSTTDFDISTIGDTKTIVYVWMSDSQKTYAPIVTAFWTVLFNALYERARNNSNRLPIPVLELMEEAGNIGKIADFVTKLTTMRSRKIYPMMIWHSIPQIKLVYGDREAEAILGACDTKIVLGCGDLETAEYMSKMIGDTTIQTQSQRGSRTTAAEPQNTTSQYASRRLMQAPEIMRLSPDDVLIWQRKRHAAILKKLKYRYWENLISPRASLDELPSYSLQEQQDDDPSSNVQPISTTPVSESTDEGIDALGILEEQADTNDPESITVPVHTGLAAPESFWEDDDQ